MRVCCSYHGARRLEREQADGCTFSRSSRFPRTTAADLSRSPISQVIFPHEANLKQLASSLGVSGGLSELVHNKQVQEAVLKALNGVGKKSNLKPLETLQTVVMTDEEWTPQNGMLTAAQKLNRKEILKQHKKEVDVRRLVFSRRYVRVLTLLSLSTQAVYP